MPTTEEAKPLTGVVDNPNDHPAQSHVDSSQKSHIGKAVLVKGNVAATEDILVDGRVEGAIAAKNSRLEIGVTAHIDANAFAKIIVINGEIKGDVHASDQVIVTHSGRVYGNIYSPDISMEDGALLKGSINMEKQDISWEDSIPETHEDDHEKSSSFGFLFRRTRGVHADHPVAAHPEMIQSKHTEEIRPIVVEKGSHDCNVSGKSLIGRSVLIKGHIESEEDVIIRGEIDGAIYFKNNGLEVGTQAHIKGNIFVKTLIALGEIKGDICASEHVSIKKPGHVIGVVRSPRVSIESGAVLMGKVEMEPQNIEEAYSHSIATPTNTKEKNSFLSKHALEASFEDMKSGLQGVVIPTKPKRVPWPE